MEIIKHASHPTTILTITRHN